MSLYPPRRQSLLLFIRPPDDLLQVMMGDYRGFARPGVCQ